MLGNKWMLRFAAEHVNVTCRQVVFVFNISEQRSRAWLGDASACLVFIASTLQRSHEEVVFRAVVVNHSQPPIRSLVITFKFLAYLGNQQLLPFEDEPVAPLDVRTAAVV